MKNKYTRRAEVVSIELPQRGKEPLYAKIDAEDLPKVFAFRRWSIQRGRSDRFYVSAGQWDQPSRNKIMLHRLIANTPEDEFCHFKNKDSFDCRRANLFNTKTNGNAHKTSPMKYIQKKYHRYYCRIAIHNKLHIVGSFQTLEAAQIARDAKIKELGL